MTAKDSPEMDRVHTLSEFAELIGTSVATLRRLVSTGKGPTITRISTRRVGIRHRHGVNWLDGRAEEDRDDAP